MKVSLDIVYCSHFYFLPLRTGEGGLFGVELITNFINVEAPVRIPTVLVLPHLNADQELTLFCEKLSLLENQQDFFKSQRLLAWVNINENIVDTILASEELITRIRQLPFIEFTINENFQDLNLGRQNPRLREISKLFSLVLANFGAGIATTAPIFDGLFTSVMLEKAFIQHLIKTRPFTPFMQAIQAQLSPFCRALLIAGIDDTASLERVRNLGFRAMQGNLWPAVQAELLPELLFPGDSL